MPMPDLPYIDHHARPLVACLANLTKLDDDHRFAERLPRFRVTLRVIVEDDETFADFWRHAQRLAAMGSNVVGGAPGQCMSERTVEALCPTAALAEVLLSAPDCDYVDMATAEALDYRGPLVMWENTIDGRGFLAEDCCSARAFHERMRWLATGPANLAW